jgi:proteasome alpha subunit
MTMPFYVSPEQVMKDKSDYARKGIARGRSVLVLQYDDGILFIGENPSKALHKISEIYDRIAFAAVGKYNEFENMRLAGVRYADLRGYQYDRRDVTSRGLANAYAQTLGTIFTESGKPYEVELVVAEVGDSQAEDQMYRLTYDGSVADEHGFVVMGGNSDPIAAFVKERHDATSDLTTVLNLAVEALAQVGPDGEPRTLVADNLEAAVLDRTRPRRAFKRLIGGPLERLLNQDRPAAPSAATDGAAPEAPPAGGAT